MKTSLGEFKKEIRTLGHDLTNVVDLYGWKQNGTVCECKKCGARLWKELFTAGGVRCNVTTVGNDIFDRLLTCTEVMIKDIIE